MRTPGAESLRGRLSEIAWHTAYDEGLVAVGPNSFMPWLGEGGFYLACGESAIQS
jgi:hypothetical protein